MKLVTFVSTLALAGALVACGKEEPPPLPETPEFNGETPRIAGDGPSIEETVAAFQAFADEAFSLEGGTEAGFDALNGALPELVSVSYDAKSFNADSGATEFDGLAITINTEPAFGLRAAEARLWGFDEDFLVARLGGERLDESSKLFDRLEAETISYFGVANAVNTLFEAFVTSIEDEEAAQDVDLAIDKFDVTAERMVVSSLNLRPFEFAPAPDSLYDFMDVPEEERGNARKAVELVQQVLAVSRTISIDDAVMYDAKVNLDIMQGSDELDIDQSIQATIGFYGYEDLSGLDIGRAIAYDVRQAQGMTFDDEGSELEEVGYPDGISYRQEETMQFFSYEGLKMDKLAGFLARGEFPGMDQKDLLSLGKWTTRDYTLKLNDGDVFKADRVNFDGEQFSWFIPNKLELDIEGAAIGVQEIGELTLGFLPTEPEEDSEAAGVVMGLQTAISKLDEHDLDTIPFDLNFAGEWNDDTGAFEVRASSESDGFGEGAGFIRLTLPDYDAVRTAMEAEDKEAAFEDAFEQSFALRGFRFFEKDDGGYDKLLGFASDIGKLYPNEGWGAMIGNMDAVQMRQFIATGIRSAKGAASQQLPQAAEWLESMALYYETPGGSLEFLSQPTVTIDMAYMEVADTGPDPQKIVDDLGFSVTYTPE
ncbi:MULTISPECIES: hypothetical protein [Henriciella]|uniref:hypothetical protein n=1 Tax=Henriciella TaxID=453849 RepID=UPI0035147C1B